MSANLKNSAWPQDWKRSVFIPIPKKGNAKECSNYCTTESEREQELRGREEQRLRGTGAVSGLEETPYVQGKEQQLYFAGAAVKRYPTSKVRETPVRR